MTAEPIVAAEVPATGAQPFVEINNVDKVFAARGRELKAVDDVSLDIAAGEFVCVVGPSG